MQILNSFQIILIINIYCIRRASRGSESLGAVQEKNMRKIERAKRDRLFTYCLFQTIRGTTYIKWYVCSNARVLQKNHLPNPGNYSCTTIYNLNITIHRVYWCSFTR